MYITESPLGDRIQVPDDPRENEKAFAVEEFVEAFEFYRRCGYALLKNVISVDYCSRLRHSFNTELKRYPGLLPRTAGPAAINKFNDRGFLVNAVLNVQRSCPNAVPTYVTDVLAILTHNSLRTILESMFKGPVGLMTWNHFEANPVTKPHHDCYFWSDDMKVGEVVGAWVALETIHPGAGRLYVYPGSHTLDLRQYMASSGIQGPLLPTSDQHQRAIFELIKEQDWKCTAPALEAGDVLLWDSRTIHGSLATTTPQHSRSSLTSHFSACSGRFIKPRSLRTQFVDGVAVEFPRPNWLRSLRRLMLLGRPVPWGGSEH